MSDTSEGCEVSSAVSSLSSSVYSGQCPDEICATRIYVLTSDPKTPLECSSCGRTFTVGALKNITPIANPGVAFQSLVRTMLLSQLVPKHTEETIRVRGLSNYHCKIVSPFLTSHGMDKLTGRAKLLRDMGKGDIFDCRLLSDRAFRIDRDLLDVPGYGHDVSGSALYLSETLARIAAINNPGEGVVPLHVDGDGHCLVHAVSRALVGRELFWHPLRCNIKRHLTDHLALYKALLKDFVDEDEWTTIIEECDPDFKPAFGEFHGLRNIHVFALANVLRRPIILVDSAACMASLGDYSALFLPALHPPKECRNKNGQLNKPLCLAWSSSGHNHFIPLVGIVSDNLPKFPVELLPKAWAVSNELVDTYLDKEGIAPHQHITIGGGNSLQDSYILRLVQAMDEVFLQRYNVSSSVVTDAHHYIYRRIVLAPLLSPKDCTGDTIMQVAKLLEERRLYRCLTCDAMCEQELSPEWLKPGGQLYVTAVHLNKGRLQPDKCYTFPSHGFTCYYNATRDELIPMFSKNQLNKCAFCLSSQLRHVRKDGALEYRNGDATKTPSTSDYCGCGFKHYWDGKLYDTLPRKLVIVINWDKKQIREPVAWFEHESDPSRNTNPMEVATHIAQRHIFEVPGGADVAAHREQIIQLVYRQVLQQTMTTQADCNSDEDLLLQLLSCANSVTSQKVALPPQAKPCRPKRLDQSSPPNTSPKPPPSKQHDDSISSTKLPTGTKQHPSIAVKPHFVRVATSTGKVSHYHLRPNQNPSMSELQQWIVSSLGVPLGRQVLKYGFPPKVLSLGPRDVVPLKHGDRIMVECLPGSDSNSPPVSGTLSEAIVAGPQCVWEYVQNQPHLFSRGGQLYTQVERDVGLVDGKHCSLPIIPNKVFTFNAAKDRLELCMEPYGHFQITDNMETKILSGQLKSSSTHFSKHHCTGGASEVDEEESSSSPPPPVPSTSKESVEEEDNRSCAHRQLDAIGLKNIAEMAASLLRDLTSSNSATDGPLASADMPLNKNVQDLTSTVTCLPPTVIRKGPGFSVIVPDDEQEASGDVRTKESAKRTYGEQRHRRMNSRGESSTRRVRFEDDASDGDDEPMDEAG